jgi:hypothetical protein
VRISSKTRFEFKGEAPRTRPRCTACEPAQPCLVRLASAVLSVSSVETEERLSDVCSYYYFLIYSNPLQVDNTTIKRRGGWASGGRGKHGEVLVFLAAVDNVAEGERAAEEAMTTTPRRSWPGMVSFAALLSVAASSDVSSDA